MTLRDGFVVIGVFSVVGGVGIGTSTIFDLINQRDHLRAQVGALAHQTPGPTGPEVSAGVTVKPRAGSVTVQPGGGTTTSAPVAGGVVKGTSTTGSGNTNTGSMNTGNGNGNGNGGGTGVVGVPIVDHVVTKTVRPTPRHTTSTPKPSQAPSPMTTAPARCSNGSLITLRVAVLSLPCSTAVVGGNG